MSDFVTSPLVVALAAQIVAGLLTGVSFWWKDHRDRRDLAKSRQAFLTQLGDEISIIETWVKAYDLVAPPDARSEGTLRAKQHLERAYNRFTEFLDDAWKVEIPTVPRQQPALETQQVVPASKATSRGFFKTIFLVRQFHTIPAKISRILYYISLVWGALWAAAGIAATVSASNAGTIIAGVFLILAGSVTFPLLSFMMANRLDRRAAGRTGSHRSQLPISSTLRPTSR